jgi:hypothetical protein
MSIKNQAKQLLVEGRDDLHVVYHLSTYAGFARGAFETIARDGYDDLVGSLEVYLLGSELQSLGIVVDADVNLAARWASITGHLANLGYIGIPATPSTGGVIVPMPNKPIIGIWVMPNNSLPGTLEDFIAYLIPSTDSLWEYACQCVNNIDPSQRPFKQSYEPKAHIHTWLAWQEEPCTPLGHAITKRYLDAQRSDAQMFIAWLKRLYNL